MNISPTSGRINVGLNLISIITDYDESLSYSITIGDSDIVSVNREGDVITITGLVIGTTTVEVSDGNTSATFTVTVSPIIALDPASVNVSKYQKTFISITNYDVAYEDSYEVSANNSKCIFVRSGATVTVTGEDSGSCIISVTDGVSSSTVDVTVNELVWQYPLSEYDMIARQDELANNLTMLKEQLTILQNFVTINLVTSITGIATSIASTMAAISIIQSKIDALPSTIISSSKTVVNYGE